VRLALQRGAGSQFERNVRREATKEVQENETQKAERTKKNKALLHPRQSAEGKKLKIGRKPWPRLAHSPERRGHKKNSHMGRAEEVGR